MKKNLLVSIGLAATFAASAQVATEAKLSFEGTKNGKTTADYYTAQSASVIKKTPESSVTRAAVNQTLIGSSWNIYTALVSESTCLTYNPEVGMLMMTHRQNDDKTGHSGIIQATYSTDGGANWSEHIVSNEAYWGRYPSGVIYNPQGNTNPNEAYGAFYGPIVSQGGDGWVGNYWTSIKMDGTNAVDTALYNDSTGVKYQNMARVTATSTTDGKVRVVGDSIDWNNTDNGILEYTAYLNTGTFNESTKGFDYETTSFVSDFELDGAGEVVGSVFSYTAWSVDGTIGYFIMLGVENGADANHRTFLPIVWKSNDSGASWTKQAAMDWMDITTITDRILPTSALANARPFFTTANGFDATVDINGELHLACEISSQFSDHQDSLAYTAVLNPYVSFFYDVHTKNGAWDAIVIDSIYTSSYDNSDWSDSGQDPITVDARLQMSRNADGSKIFYSWMTSNIDFVTENQIPDLYAKGWDVVNNLETVATNFTGGTAFEGFNFFSYMSDMTITEGSTFTIPMTVSIPTDKQLDPMQHFYVSGIEFTTEDFIDPSVLSVKNTEAINHSLAVFPNPATDNINIEVSAQNNGTAKVELLNVVGQLVDTQSINLNAGVNRTNIEVSNLVSGVYFVRATVNGVSSTSRVIVE